MERISNNCNAYIIKGIVNTENSSINIFYLKSIQKGYLSTTVSIWFAQFIMSKNRAFNIKAQCEKINPNTKWIVCEVEMLSPKEI